MGKKQTPVTNLIPSGMSENSSKSMKPPLSDEMKESKENLGKGVKTDADNSSGNPWIPGSEIYLDNPTASNSSGNPFIPFTQNPFKDKSTYKIPKKTENLNSRHDSDPEVDYDDDVTGDFIESIFDSKSSTTIPSNSSKVNNHLKKGEAKNKSRIEPENTELNSGPVKAESDPVSKSQNSKKKGKVKRIQAKV